ncbi:hypothetical protein XSR1_430002 [Xenorhabdus szentirmaii DSM 16338]|uniref:Uncharacterized protein n=1 Tax=Xenorhabdus szentirmaii DSM 16338 TaxID=1427518 RepID=W1J327_9GAMM|nr:hypothetical protein XSR1_430002 [Xenorhabdus szentirmaii DSM 16338]
MWRWGQVSRLIGNIVFIHDRNIQQAPLVPVFSFILCCQNKIIECYE